jgi:hypothetical protein
VSSGTGAAAHFPEARCLAPDSGVQKGGYAVALLLFRQTLLVVVGELLVSRAGEGRGNRATRQGNEPASYALRAPTSPVRTRLPWRCSTN